MGMIADGRWVERDDIIRDGAFVRQSSAFDRLLAKHVIDEISRGAGRYILIASMSCPWSHRALLVRAVKRLDARLPLHLAQGPRIEGYGLSADGPLHSSTDTRFQHLHQLYTRTDPSYTGRATVPLLWDLEREKIVSNGSAHIMRGLDAVDDPAGFTLIPHHLESEIGRLNDDIYTRLANAVYRAGLAQRQNTYDDAVADVFSSLDGLEDRLARQRFLLGNILTEADLRLFATLVRFDAVYTTHLRCTRHRLVDFPNVWGYARDLYAWPGIAQTVDFSAILEGYYVNDGDHNPHRIIAERPQADWRAPAGREHLGDAAVCYRS